MPSWPPNRRCWCGAGSLHALDRPRLPSATSGPPLFGVTTSKPDTPAATLSWGWHRRIRIEESAVQCHKLIDHSTVLRKPLRCPWNEIGHRDPIEQGITDLAIIVAGPVCKPVDCRKRRVER